MAARYSTAAVSMGQLALKRAIRHAEANDLVSRNVAALADTPKGQDGRPSKSLTLDQAIAVITAARTLPVMELRPGLKDVRRPAELMHAYIVLSLLAGLRTEEARALRWEHVNLDGDPAARPPVPPHVAVWRSVRMHGETKTERSRRTLGLPPPRSRRSTPGLTARPVSGSRPGTTGRTPAWSSPPTRRRPGRGQRPENFKRVCAEAGTGDGWTPRELRTLFVSLMSHQGQHRGNRPPRRARLYPHHRDRLPPRTTTGHHHRCRDHGPALHRNLSPSGPSATDDLQSTPRASTP
jgi:integrase